MQQDAALLSVPGDIQQFHRLGMETAQSTQNENNTFGMAPLGAKFTRRPLKGDEEYT